MKKTARNALLFVSVAGLGLFAGDRLLSDDADTASSQHLVNQLWVERWPRGNRDMYGKFVALRTDQGRFGVVGRSSAWRHFYEVFLWAKEGDTLMTVFPQEGHKQRFRVRTWRCEGEAPEPFELCLRIHRGERHVDFYSLEEWEVRPHRLAADLQAIESAHPELGSLAGDLAVSATPEVDPDAFPEGDVAVVGLP